MVDLIRMLRESAEDSEQGWAVDICDSAAAGNVAALEHVAELIVSLEIDETGENDMTVALATVSKQLGL